MENKQGKITIPTTGIIILLIMFAPTLFKTQSKFLELFKNPVMFFIILAVIMIWATSKK